MYAPFGVDERTTGSQRNILILQNVKRSIAGNTKMLDLNVNYASAVFR